MKYNSYQILPPLLPDEFEALKASIAERGVDVPIIVDQVGNVIDGYHRQRACEELGIFCPREIRHFESETDKLELVLRLNCGRRQLNRQQKRSLIDAYLLRDPQIADNFLAQIIGVSKNTVAAVRGELERTCQIDKFDVLRGRDGKQRPVQYKKIVANTSREAETALKVIGDLPDNCAGKTIDVTTAKRRAARKRNAAERDDLTKLVVPLTEDDIRLYRCPFQELESVADIEPNSAQLICTDIPYDQSFLPQVEELGQFARRVLVEGGILVTYSGQYWLHKVMKALGKSLTYRWINAVVRNDDATPVHIGGWKEPHARVISRWKPIVIFSKGSFPRKGQWHDVSHVVAKEKYWHPWQQQLSEIKKLVVDFCDPGDLVIDPCGGSFTTALACVQENRRFIGCDVEEKNVANGQERLRLNKELYIHLTDADDLNRPLTDGKVFDEWKHWEGVSDDLAGHILRDMPDDVRRLLDNGLPPAA